MLDVIKRCLRKFRVQKKQVSTPPTLICNNCVGGMVLHDFGIKFCTPTINLFIRPKDYILFLSDIHFYLTSEIKDKTGDSKYPVGELPNGIRIHFLHYKSFEEAMIAWYRRIERVDYNNVYVSFVAFNGTTIDDIVKFDSLPFSNKVVFVNHPMPEIKSSFYVKGFENDKGVERMTEFEGCWGKRYYDQFDWSEFLNLK